MGSALLLIDFINEIVHEKGKLSGKGYLLFIRKHQTFDHLNELLAKARQHNIPVIHVKIGFSKDYSDCPPASPLFGAAKQHGALQIETWATQFHEDIKINEKDNVLVKHRVSAFYGTELNTLLKKLTVTNIYIAGVATDLAVQTTARDAHDRDYTVIVIDDCCAAASDEDHDVTISLLRKVAKIANSSEIYFNEQS